MWVEKYVFLGKCNNNNVTKMSSTNYIDSKSTPLREVSPWTCPTCRTSCWSCPAACPSPAACFPSPVYSCQLHAAASQGLCSAGWARHPPSPCPPPPGSTGSGRGSGWALPCFLFWFNFPSLPISVSLWMLSTRINAPSMCIQTPWSSIWPVSQL